MNNPVFKKEHPIREIRRFHLQNTVWQPVITDQSVSFSP